MSWSADTWIALIALGFSIVGPTVVWFFRSTAKDEIDDAIEETEKRSKENVDKLEREYASLERTVIGHDRAIIKVEEAIKALPAQRDIQDLNKHVSELAGDMKRMVAEIHSLGQGQERTETAIGVINETLMQRQQR